MRPELLELFDKMGIEQLQPEVKRYPLTDISYDENKNLYVEIALAGFSRDDITVEHKGDSIVITGVHSKDELVDVQYVQQHISQRDFERVIKLNPIYRESDVQAGMEDGILSIIIAPSQVKQTFIQIS